MMASGCGQMAGSPSVTGCLPQRGGPPSQLGSVPRGEAQCHLIQHHGPSFAPTTPLLKLLCPFPLSPLSLAISVSKGSSLTPTWVWGLFCAAPDPALP